MILVIYKNVEDLCRLADRHYIMEKGTTVWHGTTAELRANDAAVHRYLGM